MIISLIGQLTNSTTAIQSLSQERGVQFTYSGEIDSFEGFKQKVSAVLMSEVIVVDITQISAGVDDFERMLDFLTNNYRGLVIVFAPGASYGDEKLEICADKGFENHIRDVLTSRIKSKLSSMIADVKDEHVSVHAVRVEDAAPPLESRKTTDTARREEIPQGSAIPNIPIHVSNATKEIGTNTYRPANVVSPIQTNQFDVSQKQHIPINRTNEHRVHSMEEQIEPSVITRNVVTRDTTLQKRKIQETVHESKSREYEDKREETVQSYNRNIQPTREDYREEESRRYRNDAYESQPFNPVSEQPKVIVTKKVGVIGVLPRIGVTTQALMMLRTIQRAEHSVCYIQQHESTFLNNLENFFSGVEKSPNKGCLIYEGIDFYQNPNLVLSQNYEYHIKDYGSCINQQVPPDFFNNDIRVIVCGGTAEEVSCLTALRSQLFVDNNLVYVFSFIADYEQDDIRDLMGEKTNAVIFAPYAPDCFKLEEETKRLYFPIFQFEEKEEPKKKGLFKKRRR